MRADVLLVARGLAPSRTAAQRLIEAGHVFTRHGDERTKLGKPSVSVHDDITLEVETNELDRYVSRGGLKLEGALQRVVLEVRGLHCLDVGQSTGGFTDCLLRRGAAHVVGVDVGHEQLHSSLRSDSRVTCIEGLNARELNAATLQSASASLPQSLAASRSYIGFDLIVADVSFISVTKVLPAWCDLLTLSGKVLSLVKPQFEVGADNLARGGIVRDESLFAIVETSMRDTCKAHQLRVLDYFESAITGTDGNHEFFVYAERAT
jgi:23S rRNA (cytidine1920-2'-O)/16S rRNA (cytidine1409-2'-O)-methyltransferase